MIPRYQRILFWILLVSSVLMSVVLIRMRERAHDRLLDSAETMPLNPPADKPAQNVTMIIANDLDGSLAAVEQRIALPTDSNARAHVILQHLIADYARPDSNHPIVSNNGVQEVFFMNLPAQASSAGSSAGGGGSSGAGGAAPGVMAIVDFSGSFAAAHPSGIEPEMLTLLSIIGTLHANFPAVTQVRFLVDGQQRDTLAGHADLTRAYVASNAPGVKHL